MQEYYDITIYSLEIHGKDKHLFRIMNENSALMLLYNKKEVDENKSKL